METLLIHPTDETGLEALQTLWNDGEVMHDVGFPQGLGTTPEKMHQWYAWLCAGRPQRDHFSIVMDDRFCGEAFYAIDAHGYAALDIKLFAFARSKGFGQRGLRHAIREAFHHGAHTVWVDPNQANDKALALYHRLGFRASSRPAHQEDTPGCVYLQLKKQDLKVPWGIDEPELWLASFQGPLPFEVSPTEVKTVLTTFCSSLEPLILTPLPAREKHKWILIAAVSREFEPQREYSEKEIMAVLKPMNPDPITIRRYLVDYHFLWRTRDGSQYGKVEHHD